MRRRQEKIRVYLDGVCEVPTYLDNLVVEIRQKADTITLKPNRANYLPGDESFLGIATFSNSATGDTIMHPESNFYGVAPQPAYFSYRENERSDRWKDRQLNRKTSYRIKSIEVPKANAGQMRTLIVTINAAPIRPPSRRR